MKNKLIVDRNQAKKIRDNDTCEISMSMRIKHGISNQDVAVKKFLNQILWVAEPLCTIKRGEERYAHHFSCDAPPSDWERATLDLPGSRVHFGRHRFFVECISVRAWGYSAGKMFTVFLTLKKVKGVAL